MIIDIVYGALKDLAGITNSIVITASTLAFTIQGAFLLPLNNIELDLAKDRYKDTLADLVKFVLESCVETCCVPWQMRLRILGLVCPLYPAYNLGGCARAARSD
jgi:hypothetical protein